VEEEKVANTVIFLYICKTSDAYFSISHLASQERYKNDGQRHIIPRYSFLFLQCQKEESKYDCFCGR